MKRLDLDAIKNKARKLRSANQPENMSEQTKNEINEIDIELRRLQEDFDKQVALVTEICNKIITSNDQHVKYLSKFAETQAEYYEHANKHLSDLLNNENDEDPMETRSGSTGFATFAALSGDT